MLRTSLGFVGVALLCLVGADLEISTLEPWEELGRIGWGFLTPDASALSHVGDALVNTITDKKSRS